MELFELMRSIEEKGILVPLLVRPNSKGSGYEIIAGHRRKAASEWAGIDSVPVMVVPMNDEDAIIAMVDSNLQREHIKPSEKAFAYKMVDWLNIDVSTITAGAEPTQYTVYSKKFAANGTFEDNAGNNAFSR